MKRIWTILLSVGLLASLAMSTIALNHQATKIAYVRTADLLEGYAGMEEAMAEFETMRSQYERDLQQQQNEFELAMETYKADSSGLSSSQRGQRRYELLKMAESLNALSQEAANAASTHDQELTAGVLNQVNSFVSTYGAANGYQVILGTTGEGNLMYAPEAIDITDALLASMNEHYKEG